jgi:hypothetical protein
LRTAQALGASAFAAAYMRAAVRTLLALGALSGLIRW